jgi:hypothetical protein
MRVKKALESMGYSVLPELDEEAALQAEALEGGGCDPRYRITYPLTIRRMIARTLLAITSGMSLHAFVHLERF